MSRDIADAVEALYDQLLPVMQIDSADQYGDKVKAQAIITAALTPAGGGEVVAGSCASCNGTGDLGGNPSYGMCPDCDGTGKFPPAAPSKVVEALTEAFEFLGGVDGAVEIRSRILSALGEAP